MIASRSCRWERLRMPLHDKGLDSTTPWPSVLIGNRINLVLRELLPVEQNGQWWAGGGGGGGEQEKLEKRLGVAT